MQKYFYTDEDLVILVKESMSISEVCRKLGIINGGGAYERVRLRIKSLNIECSHFVGKASGKIKGHPGQFKRKPKEEIFMSNHKCRLNAKVVGRNLIELGAEYKCSCCGLSEWMSKPITLDIDHIDGDWSNYNVENLRFLCPNCHRQTDTFGGRNKR